MTLIIGRRCSDGVVLAADRRELRGLEPSEHGKIMQINLKVQSSNTSVTLAGAGVNAFWDEVAWSTEQYLRSKEAPKAKTFQDIISLISVTSVNLSARYQHGGTDEKLGCVLAGLDALISGKAKMYYFAGAGFTVTNFICLGSGDSYALPLADVLLNSRSITIEAAVRFMPLLFLLVERVNISVSGGPDIFVVRDGSQTVQVPVGQVNEGREKAVQLLKSLPAIFNKKASLKRTKP